MKTVGAYIYAAASMLAGLLLLPPCISSAEEARTRIGNVSMEEIQKAIAFAHSDRICRNIPESILSAQDDYESCMQRITENPVCSSSGVDVAQLLALVSVRKDLRDVFSKSKIVEALAARCGNRSLTPSSGETRMARSALSGNCSYRMPVLLAYAIRQARKPSTDLKGYVYCSSALGRQYVESNCSALDRLAAIGDRWPPTKPRPKALGVERLLCGT